MIKPALDINIPKTLQSRFITIPQGQLHPVNDLLEALRICEIKEQVVKRGTPGQPYRVTYKARSSKKKKKGGE